MLHVVFCANTDAIRSETAAHKVYDEMQKFGSLFDLSLPSGVVSPSRGTNASSIQQRLQAAAAAATRHHRGLPRVKPPGTKPLVYDRNNNTRPL